MCVVDVVAGVLAKADYVQLGILLFLWVCQERKLLIPEKGTTSLGIRKTVTLNVVGCHILECSSILLWNRQLCSDRNLSMILSNTVNTGTDWWWYWR
jgi:hypothetical protein